MRFSKKNIQPRYKYITPNITNLRTPICTNSSDNHTFDTLSIRVEQLIKTFKESNWQEHNGESKMQYVLKCKRDSISMLNDLSKLHHYQVIMNSMDDSEKETRSKLENFHEELDTILKRQFKIYLD